MVRRVCVALLMSIVLSRGVVGAQETSRVIVEGDVAAPPAQVWTAWTTAEGLRSWMAPVADIDLRVGGLMRSNYDAKGTLDDDGAIVNTILSFEPERMLSIQVARAPKGFPFPNAVHSMWTVIYLTPAQGGAVTHVRAVSLGFTPDEESQRMRAFFERGNAVTLRELQGHFSR